MLSRASISLAERIGRFIPPVVTDFGRAVLVGALCAVAGVALRFAIDPWVNGGIPVTLFYPFIMIASIWGGTTAGIASLVITAAAADYFWLPPRWAFTLTKPNAVTLIAFATTSGFVILTAGIFRALLDVHRKSATQAILLAHEMQHRAGNLLGVVNAIASQTLRRSTSLDQFKTSFESRLTALASAHTLIVNNPAASLDLHALLQSLIRPFGPDRFLLDGPHVDVPPYLGTSCALVLHELSTNATKYGALSNPDGKVLINWHAESNWVRLNWLEKDGPPVALPAHTGFGSRLLRTAFPPNMGTVEIDYHPDGVRCSLAFELATAENPPAQDWRKATTAV